ncbi:E3 ubiquitin-protein ligase RNF114-like isoform X2 [Scleropages formosus]|uniref:E3 ubiquitin-protein ligase RNF114-like isoform X2 n=1 Tax=Scleropages formosus TaxID=113540 RepID=UPI0008784BBE|nr:E3 ubiquitin-protein ligase RNF114-like isoform X2 [Scleropages formosus]
MCVFLRSSDVENRARAGCAPFICRAVAQGVTPERLATVPRPLSMYCCPYCPLQGLRDTALVQHCLGSHPTARSPAVCPICAATSWGDASYRSGNFIGHLRLRHRFSYNNYMDMNEDEDVQVNRALQESRCPDVAVLTPSP